MIQLPDQRIDPPDEPQPLYICDNCDSGIYVGDEYVEYCGDKICMTCVENNTTTAEEEEREEK